ncbi:MAG: 4-hydroxy-tetrahydrodipicolinate reductase [Coriobacteriia bacterium]|nr:4-hydroxy-tetrahydrodipicolinate reductase [Coriobacteriia bacterium]
MTKVLVNGYLGRMGSEVVRAVCAADDLSFVGGFEPTGTATEVSLDSKAVGPAFTDLATALEAAQPNVVVDFTIPSSVESNIRTCMAAGVPIVVGTTGLTPEQLAALEADIPANATVFIAPNFTTGAILMMAASKLAARFFDDVEVLEFHHNRKLDAPSGTALSTARAIAEVRAEAGLERVAPGKETESAGNEGARGAFVQEVPVHAIRSNGFVASQEVIFGSPGQTLSIRHDSIDRAAYMPGVLLAVRSVATGSHTGLIVGLEKFMDLGF